MTHTEQTLLVRRLLNRTRDRLREQERFTAALREQALDLEAVLNNLNETAKADPDFVLCGHPASCVAPGPRVQRLYGHGDTELCTACNGYRVVTQGLPGAWIEGPPNTKDEDEEL